MALVYDGTSTSRRLLQDEFYKDVGFHDWYNKIIRNWFFAMTSNRDDRTILANETPSLIKTVDGNNYMFVDLIDSGSGSFKFKCSVAPLYARRARTGYEFDSIFQICTRVTLKSDFSVTSTSCIKYGFPNVKMDMKGKKCRVKIARSNNLDNSEFYCCELLAPGSNRWYKFSISDVNFEFPDPDIIENNYRLRFNREPQPGKTVKVRRKNNYGIPSGTRGVIKRVFTVGDEEFGKYAEIEFPEESAILPARKFIVINVLDNIKKEHNDNKDIRTKEIGTLFSEGF